MKRRNILNWLSLCALFSALGASPQEASHRDAGAPPRAAAPAQTGPVPRLQARIGAAPKRQFQVNNRTFSVDTKDPGVAAVRTMAPKSFEPASRVQSVNRFYKAQLAGKIPSKEQLASLYVGPYRREFIWWALNAWELKDRAWWAWNNYAYFDQTLWDQWMLNREFADLIAQYQAQHLARQLGYIPPQYASNAPEVIYNDEYIEAVYNPEPTPPSIIVDSTAGGHLSNLVEGVPRIFGHGSKSISSIGDRVKRYQFVSIPADFDPTYQITVKRDGDLYVFGPKKTSAAEAFGADAPNWRAVSNLVNGPGIEITYQRQVKAGDKIHVHGIEWSIASEQIELFSPASPEALAAARHVARDLEKMAANKGAFIEANPSLVDYTEEARDAANQIMTANGNIDDDAVADCRYELSNLQKLSEAALLQTSDAQVIIAGKDFVRRVGSLQESLSEADGSRDSGLGEPTTVATAPSVTGPGTQVAGSPAQGSTVDLLKLIDVTRDTVSGGWKLDGDGLTCGGGRREKVIKLPYSPPAEYDYSTEFTVLKTVDWGDVDQICEVGNRSFEWMLGGAHNTKHGFIRTANGQIISVTGQNLLQPGQLYHSVVQVRRNRVTALLDGKEIGVFDGDVSALGLAGAGTFTRVLGLRCWSQTRFSKIELVEVGGVGQIVGRDAAN
jgi:hypothetical protein